MNFIDITILIPLAYAAWKGFKHGLIIEIFTLMALVLGIYAGIHFSDYASKFLKDALEWNSKYLPVVAFTLTFLAVGAMVYFGGKAIERVVKFTGLSPINKTFGIIFSLIKMGYFISVLIVLLESYDEKNDFFPEETKAASLLYEPIKNLSTSTIPGITESTIFLKNALKEETEKTQMTVDQVLRAKEIADSLGIDASDAIVLKEVYDKHEANRIVND
jgi:membrane protein required for colicin V production